MWSSLGTQSCEDVSGESGRTTLGQGISDVRVAMNFSGESGLTTSAQGISELRGQTGRTVIGHGIFDVRVAKMSHAKMA